MKLSLATASVLALAVLVLVPVTARADGASPAPTARVHLRSSVRAQLVHRDSETGGWEKVCEAPCDVPVPLGEDYRILEVKDHRYGDVFRLSAPPGGDVTIEYSPASRGRATVGGVMAGVGLVLAIVCSVVVASIEDEPKRTPQPTYSDRDDDRNTPHPLSQAVGDGLSMIGRVFAVSGLVLGSGSTVAGVALLASSGASTSQSEGRVPTWSAPTPAVPATRTIVPIEIKF